MFVNNDLIYDNDFDSISIDFNYLNNNDGMDTSFSVPYDKKFCYEPIISSDNNNLNSDNYDSCLKQPFIYKSSSNLINDENIPNFNNNNNGAKNEIGIITNNMSNQITASRTALEQKITFNKYKIKGIKNKIFYIRKIKKNLGRKRANSAQKNSNNKKIHTKYKDDNIRIKLIRALYKHSVNHTNKLLKKSKNPDLNSLELLKVDNSILIVHQKEEYLKLLKTQLKTIFSNKIGKKYSAKEIDHNEKIMKKIEEQNDKDINDVINLTLDDILKIYISKNRISIFEDFPNIDADIANLQKKGHDDNYTNKYKIHAKQFKDLLDKMVGRPKRIKYRK